MVLITVTVTAASATVFDVDPTTVPFWLNLGAMSGTTPNVAVTMQANASTATLGVGSYAASIHFKVSGFADYVVPVALAINNGANVLSVAEGTTQALTWIYGATAPTKVLTVVSSGQPAPFTVTTQNTTVTSTENVPANWIQSSTASGIAYNFGTPITVSFLPDVLANAKVGASLTGTVTVTYGAGTTIVVTFTIDDGNGRATVRRCFLLKFRCRNC